MYIEPRLPRLPRLAFSCSNYREPDSNMKTHPATYFKVYDALAEVVAF
jgi:hypothetical protein